RLQSSFKVALGNRRSQAAEMVLPPGESEGGSDNRHRGADQWLFVVSGTGQAIVNRHRYRLRAGTLLLIERGDTHEIKNTGREKLVTLNFYVPPAYTDDRDELPAGKSSLWRVLVPKGQEKD
ncbi:MAG: cupin domain-containing protein, partial [Planctomycetia bacterium]|nr:cupin domain-containing protein [Planctomycetia bacterium]